MLRKSRQIVSLSLFSLAVFTGAAIVGAEGVSKGTVDLEINEEMTQPQIPENPSKPLEPGVPEDEGGTSTNNKGPLSLDVAPTKFDFGKQKMYQTSHTYQAVNTSEQSENITSQYLQVTDNRDAGTYGWKVKVKQDRYLTSNEGYELSGTTINIPLGVARNSLNEDPTQSDLNFTMNPVSVTTEDKTLFGISSELEHGKATTTYVWKSSDVSLTIPAKTAKAGSYSNNIIWTLTADAPN